MPFAPGGPTDTVGRLIAQKLQEIWGQPVIVDYKPGAGTAIGADFVAKSAPDGLTFGMVNSSFAVNPSLRKTLPYDTQKDLAGITQIANLQLAIVARPDAPFNTLPELIAYAKKNPGKLTYGTPGAGSTTHLGAELLKREAGFDMLHSPFKGSAPAHTELMGGRIDLVVDPFLSILPYVKAGRMKMIATMGEKRGRRLRLPDGRRNLPGFSVNALLGFVAPHGHAARDRAEDPGRHRAACCAAPRCASASRNRAWRSSPRSPSSSTPSSQSEMKRWARVISEAEHQRVTEIDPMSLQLKPLHPRLRRRGQRHRHHPPAVRHAKCGRSTPAMNQYAVLVWRGQPLTRPAADRLRQVLRPARHRPEAGVQAARAARGRAPDRHLQRRCARQRGAARLAQEPVELRQPALAQRQLVPESARGLLDAARAWCCRAGAATPSSPTCAPPTTRLPERTQARDRRPERRALRAAHAHPAGRRGLHRRAEEGDPAGGVAAGADASGLGPQAALRRRPCARDHRLADRRGPHATCPTCWSTRRSASSSTATNGRWATS